MFTAKPRPPPSRQPNVTSPSATLPVLVGLGIAGETPGGASIGKAAACMTFGGAFAMAITAGSGTLFRTQLGKAMNLGWI